MIATLAEAASSMHGKLQGDDRPFKGISTDTRTIGEGELFFALQGPNFDGRDYVGIAKQNGAAGAVVTRRTRDAIAQIEVGDTRSALGRFGAAWRRERDVMIVGVTGSNGKTTLKELVAACLGRKAPTLATHGNLNNDIGVPLMLARIEEQHRFAVIEMGANHAVSRGKGEILQDEKRPMAAVLNADDRYFDYWSSLVEDVRCISFGFSEAADVRAIDVSARVTGTDFTLHLGNDSFAVSLPLMGVHNVRNACAAAAVAHALDVDLEDIRRGLEEVSPVGGRLQPVRGVGGATLFDDSYNANPLSVKAAAEFIAALPGESWLVLGDMKELGDDAAELHREVGEAARASGVDRLFAYGDLASNAAEGFGENARWYGSLETLVDELCEGLASDVNVLVKGSRSMRMERVVDAVREMDDVRREA
jgi:UDP-N-acetylmuramoyl-tripeptide--D-alanyl-D-alanine ligase